MIRAKELERKLCRGMLRREPGRKSRYQFVLRNMSIEDVDALAAALVAAFPDAAQGLLSDRKLGHAFTPTP